MRIPKQKYCVSLIAFAILVFISHSAPAQEPSAPIKPRIPDGWTQLPKWAEQGLPFDAKSYYAIEESENREPLYLKAFLEFDYGSGSLLFPGLDEQADFQAKFDADRTRWNNLYEYLRQNPNEGAAHQSDAEIQLRAEKILTSYQTAFEKLEAAQKRKRCFFHCEIDTDNLNVYDTVARGISRVLRLRCSLDLPNNNAVRNVRMALQLKRDLQPLGGFHVQLCAFSIESECFDWIVSPILGHQSLGKEQLDELCANLADHFTEQGKVDPFIEAGRYECLMLRSLMRQLENGEYAANVAERSENLGLKDTVPVPLLIIHELTQFGLGGYSTNSAVIEQEMAALAQKNPAIEDAAEKFSKAKQEIENERSELEKLMGDDRLDNAVVAPFLLGALVSMTADDYGIEVSVLDHRYRQIESACALPFPKSTGDLEILADNWTTDDAWKKTKILKWFKPDNFIHSIRRKSALRTNAYLCLAAAIKWQREHEAKPPENLSEALRTIGITEIPVDPYSGDPLKMTMIDDRVVIYSVGPDGDDDAAAKRFDLFGNPPTDPIKDPNGDVVFSVDYATGK